MRTALSIVLLLCFTAPLFAEAEPIDELDADPPREPTETRVYDLRHLLRPVPEFPYEIAPQAATAPAADEAEDEEPSCIVVPDWGPPARARLITLLIELVQDSTGDPAAWLDQVFAIQELNGNFVIRTTPTVHAEIADLFSQIWDARPRVLAIQADVFTISRVDLLAVRRAIGVTGQVLDPQQVSTLQEMLVKKQHGMEPVATTQFSGIESRRVHVVMGQPDAASDQPRANDVDDVSLVIDLFVEHAGVGRLAAVTRVYLDTSPRASRLRCTTEMDEDGGVFYTLGATDDDKQKSDRVTVFLLRLQPEARPSTPAAATQPD